MTLTQKLRRSFVINKSNLFVVVALGAVSILLVACSLVLLVCDQNTRAVYQKNNYARFAQNLASFEEFIRYTDDFVNSIDNESPRAMPHLANATAEELEKELLRTQEDGPIFVSESSPFASDYWSHNAFGRLQVMMAGNPLFSDIVLYVPKSGYYVGIAQDGMLGYVARNDEEMRGIIPWEMHPAQAEDGALIYAKGSAHIPAKLYVVRKLNVGMVLVVGINEKEMARTIFDNNTGKSYQRERMALRLDDGTVLWNETPQENKSGLFDVNVLFRGEENVREESGYTVMEFSNAWPAYRFAVVLSETGANNASSSKLFMPFICLNMLWLMTVAIVCSFVSWNIIRPLRALNTRVAPGDQRGDMLENLTDAFDHYDQRLLNQQMTINHQRLQLRRAHLYRLIMGQSIAISHEDSEAMGLAALLETYMLMVIYPESGRWAQGEGSEQERAYQSHIAMFAARETLHTLLEDNQPEFVICGAELIAILIPVKNQTEEEIHIRAEQSLLAAGQKNEQSFRFGMSGLYHGVDGLNRAYREAQRRMEVLEEDEGARSEEINLNDLLKPNMRMADLIYVEKYREAYKCFKETLGRLYQQKNRRLREQQISSFLSLTYCMLLETNEGNASLLEQVNLDGLRLPVKREELEENWASVFGMMEDQREEKTLAQYSSHFAMIFQYVHAHFRDTNLSLSLLSEEFGMSLPTLSREFQKNLGEGFLDCLHHMRIDAARHEIEQTNKTLVDIAAEVGYTNTLTMTRAFKKYLGCTPGVFRKKGEKRA